MSGWKWRRRWWWGPSGACVREVDFFPPERERGPDRRLNLGAALSNSCRQQRKVFQKKRRKSAEDGTCRQEGGSGGGGGGDTLRNNGGGLEMARMFERGINSPGWWWIEGVQTEGRTAE